MNCDCMFNILIFLDIKTIKNISVTCKSCSMLIYNDYLWCLKTENDFKRIKNIDVSWREFYFILLKFNKLTINFIHKISLDIANMIQKIDYFTPKKISLEMDVFKNLSTINSSDLITFFHNTSDTWSFDSLNVSDDVINKINELDKLMKLKLCNFIYENKTDVCKSYDMFDKYIVLRDLSSDYFNQLDYDIIYSTFIVLDKLIKIIYELFPIITCLHFDKIEILKNSLIDYLLSIKFILLQDIVLN